MAAAVLGLGCSTAPVDPRPCRTSGECAAGARCVSGACVTNSPPTARIALPSGPLEATLLLGFDGSASADPDPGDSIATHTWSFRAVAADCAPPAVAGTGPVAQVRFACPGTYEVELAVADQLGAAGTQTRQLTVAPYSGPALLLLGPDVSVAHACTQTPVRCAPSAPVALSASATEAAPAGLSFLWSVEPPAGLALDASRRVAFAPGADAPAPSVSIETDGQAISGDWIFRVEARDGVGVVASGAVRVSVGNQPPVLAGSIPVPDHAFDGVQLTASGEVPFTVTDPDGDPLAAPVVEWHHVGDGTNGAFTGTVLEGPSRVTYSIVVPYATPSDAEHLIGGAGLERSIVFSVADVNGARAAETWPVTVGNRPPVLVSGPSMQTVNHGYDTAGQRYVADATLATWSDPDGDPLFPATPTGSGVCASYDVLGGGAAVHCSAPYPGAPQLGSIVGLWPVTVAARDPWTSAGSASGWVDVLNRAPRIAQTSVSTGASCIEGACCRKDADLTCVAWYETYPSGSVGFGGVVADDDGDPLNILVNGIPSPPCPAASCAVSGSLPQRGPVCGKTPVTDTWTVEASDGMASAAGTLTVRRTCR